MSWVWAVESPGRTKNAAPKGFRIKPGARLARLKQFSLKFKDVDDLVATKTKEAMHNTDN